MSSGCAQRRRGRAESHVRHGATRVFFFSSRRRHTRLTCDWSSDVCSSDLRRTSEGADLSSLREIAYGTAPITPSSLAAAVSAFGCRFRQIYGNTESQSMISLLAPEDHQPGHPRLGSAGRVSFGWEVRIVDPDGRDLGFEEAGELLIRGEPLFSGYWRDPEATAAAFAEGGWYRAGDIGKLTADGYLYILDRAKDMIISGGENIYPAEVEAVLARHPAVADVAVVARQDPAWGEAVHAVVIPASEGASAGEIIAWCRDRLAHFKCPKSVEFTDALPRTTTGKVLSRERRARPAGRERRPGTSGFRSRRTAGCRRRRSVSWPGRPNGPGSARFSWPRGTATRWPCAIRWWPRPRGCRWERRWRTRPCGRPRWRPRPRRSWTRRPAAGSSWAWARATL